MAIYILERQAGVACMVPVGITVATSIIVIHITSAIGGKQIQWMEAIQKRVATISSLLASVKGAKMRGLEDKTYDIINGLRSHDIKCGNSFRKIIAYAGVLSFVPEFLCPFFTFLVLIAAPGISGYSFDATKILSVLAALLVLTQPLANGFQILPSVLAGSASLKRIGIFLLTDEQSEIRRFDHISQTSSFELECSEKSLRDCVKQQASAIEIRNKEIPPRPASPAFQIKGGAFRWGNKADTLSDVNVSVTRAMLTTIIGPVGSGKTTLCETLLGQTQKSSGEVYARIESPEIAYCSQTPYLVNASIRENIITHYMYERDWYLIVLQATALLNEVSAMPNGEDTIIGINGSKLSGSQRQRLAIARAFYSRKRTVILDDVQWPRQDKRANNIQKTIGPGRFTSPECNYCCSCHTFTSLSSFV